MVSIGALGEILVSISSTDKTRDQGGESYTSCQGVANVKRNPPWISIAKSIVPSCPDKCTVSEYIYLNENRLKKSLNPDSMGY
jgi:hypothetical protein